MGMQYVTDLGNYIVYIVRLYSNNFQNKKSRHDI